jgi:two-component system OmpR family sensor kinase
MNGAAGLRGWLASRTLRGRLIAGLLVLLALACAAVGLVTYLVLHQTLLNQLDKQLTLAGGRYAQCMEHAQGNADQDTGRPGQPPPLSPQACGKITGQPAGTFGARVKDGVVTNKGIVGNGHCRLSPADAAWLARLQPDGQFYNVALTPYGDYRLTATPGHDGDVLITGLPLAGMESTLGKVELGEVVTFAAVLVAAGLLGSGWVRLSLRPLRRVAATATRVTELPLASGEVALPERVPDVNPRTEVGQLGTAFNRMLSHVEAALARRAKSEARLRRFAADASHELRTPLAAIRGYAELARRHPGPVPDDIAHALGRVEAEASRMSVLVDELLLLAQLDAGRPLAREPVDLTRLAIDAASDARAAAPDHKWLLELPDEPVVVSGDEHRLHQVLTNLLSNAARHTPSGTRTTVRLDRHDARAELSVTDNGPGIPPDLQQAVFGRFVRGDSARSHAGPAGGTGLGLAIVHAVVTAHGGGVMLSSQPGLTSFVITLPADSG